MRRAALARRAARMAEGKLNEKANLRFDAAALAAISRIFAREAALRVAQDGHEMGDRGLERCGERAGRVGRP